MAFEGVEERSRMEREPMDLERECMGKEFVEEAGKAFSMAIEGNYVGMYMCIWVCMKKPTEWFEDDKAYDW